MQNSSPPVQSNQVGVFDGLETVVRKHLQTEYKKPIAEHTQKAFDDILPLLEQHRDRLILDSGCGTGESTMRLAERFPEYLVVGVDRSAIRLGKRVVETPCQGVSTVFVRADLVDFWRLLRMNKFIVQKHFLFYPNPYPKREHFRRRWHGHPVFPDLVAVSRELELRTNWKLYAEEFALAWRMATGRACEVQMIGGDWQSVSNFEQKYRESGHELYRLMAEA